MPTVSLWSILSTIIIHTRSLRAHTAVQCWCCGPRTASICFEISLSLTFFLSHNIYSQHHHIIIIIILIATEAVPSSPVLWVLFFQTILSIVVYRPEVKESCTRLVLGKWFFSLPAIIFLYIILYYMYTFTDAIRASVSYSIILVITIIDH